MKILFCTNGTVALPLVNWLGRMGNRVEIASYPLTDDIVEEIDPDHIISYNYRHIITEDIINRMVKGNIINLHTSYLPYNRGAHPNLWSILDHTPRGVTIHRIDKGIDTGDIILQRQVERTDTETLKESYDKLHKTIQQLFKEWYVGIGEHKPTPQEGDGTYHTTKDLEELKAKIGDFDWNITIKELKKRYEDWQQNDRAGAPVLHSS